MSIRIILDRPDQPYELHWDDIAEARLSSLARPPDWRDLRDRRRGLYAMCALLWAAIAERGHRFMEPEELAPWLKTREQQMAGIDALALLAEQAFPPDPKKKSRWSRRERETDRRLTAWATLIVVGGLGTGLDPATLTPAQRHYFMETWLKHNTTSAAPRGGSYSERAFIKRMLRTGLAREAKA